MGQMGVNKRYPGRIDAHGGEVEFQRLLAEGGDVSFSGIGLQQSVINEGGNFLGTGRAVRGHYSRISCGVVGLKY